MTREEFKRLVRELKRLGDEKIKALTKDLLNRYNKEETNSKG